MKECLKCHKVKPLAEFVKDKRIKSGVAARCLECDRPAKMVSHYKNHDRRLQNLKDYRERTTMEKRAVLLDWLHANPCVMCGEADIRVLQCDHIDPSQKQNEISFILCRAMPVKHLIEELKKCRSLCANCHMRHTSETNGFWRSKEVSPIPVSV